MKQSEIVYKALECEGFNNSEWECVEELYVEIVEQGGLVKQLVASDKALNCIAKMIRNQRKIETLALITDNYLHLDEDVIKQRTAINFSC